MTDLKMLALYLGIAIVLSLVMGRSVLFRRILGSRDHDEKAARRTEKERYVHTIASSGTGVTPETLYGRTTFRATWGLRLVGLALSSCVLFMLGQSVWTDMILGKVGGDAFWFLGAVAVWIYYNFYIFTYEVTIFEGEIINSTWLLGRARFPLHKLKHFEHDTSGFYRLEFAGGGMTYVLQYVQGRDRLHRALKEALEMETYAPVPGLPR
ncbi:hypothetical protein [Shimia sediminis]|uniref:hypothetical protein n=1 Tax=Shimia sediminis TaxID=2497945 RepID=UPI000F8C7D8A|nr:hypothetical protein [Shimia sediminis]